VFAAQVDDHPAAIALLEVLGGQRYRLAAAQAAADACWALSQLPSS
jgi:hypothetical protein